MFSSRWKDTEARRQRSKVTSGVAGGWERSRCPRLRFPESLFDMRTLFSCWPLFTDPRIAQSSAQCLVSSNSGRVSAVAAAAAMWGTDTTCDHRLDKTSSSTEIEVNVCLSSAFSSATKRCHLNIYLSSSVSVLIFMTWQVSRYLTLCVYPTLRVHTRWPDAGDQIIYSTKKGYNKTTIDKSRRAVQYTEQRLAELSQSLIQVYNTIVMQRILDTGLPLLYTLAVVTPDAVCG